MAYTNLKIRFAFSPISLDKLSSTSIIKTISEIIKSIIFNNYVIRYRPIFNFMEFH